MKKLNQTKVETESGNLTISVPSRELTESAGAFHQELSETMKLFTFIINIVLNQDYVSHVALTALENEEISKELTPGKLAEKNPGKATIMLRKHSQTLLQMFLCRMVDNLTVYLSDVTREVLRSCPEILKSGEQFRLDCILSYESLEDFTRSIIERKVTELSYLGFNQLTEWFKNRLGLDFSEDNNFQIIVETLETRNVIVHNRAIIGEKYIRNVANPRFQIGEIRKLDVDDLFIVTKEIVSFVNTSDETIATKFGLKRKILENTEL